MTQFERIKSMDIKELAELLLRYDCEYNCWRPIGAYPECQKSAAIRAQIEWLESEVQ